MKRLDDWLIGIVQEAYLWLWDWTGAMVATPFFLAVILDKVCWPRHNWLDYLFAAWMAIVAAAMYRAQSTSLKRFNDMQRRWRDLGLRKFAIILVSAGLIFSVIGSDWQKAASDFFTIAWILLGCVQVREREPKDFFRVLARAGA
jgi:hypothetical protein